MTEEADIPETSVENYEAQVSETNLNLEKVSGLSWTLHNDLIELIKKNTPLGKFIVDNDSIKEVRSGNKYPISFTEPVFISYILITFVDDSIDFVIECVDLFDKKSAFVGRKLSSKNRQYNIRKATQEVLLSNNAFFSKKRKISDIKIVGCSTSQLDEQIERFEATIEENSVLIKKANSLKDDLRSDLSKYKERFSQREQLAEEIEYLKNERFSISEEVKKEAKSVESLQEKEAELSAGNKLLQNNNESLRNSVDQLENDRKHINKDISELKQQLKVLHDDKNAFTEDVIEFNRRSNDQKIFYLGFSICLILAIICLAGVVFFNALNTANSIPNWDEAFRVFVARIPLLSMTAIISLACFYLIKGFFVKIMDIDRQQLNFAKLGIIAKDVSVYASQGLEGISEEFELERRIRLKMDLLKDFLSEELGKQYDYSKKADEQITKAIPRWANEIEEIFKKVKEESESVVEEVKDK